MTSSSFADRHLVCASCEQTFVFSAGEQELRQLRGIGDAPTRCPPCARGGGLLHAWSPTTGGTERRSGRA